MKARIAILSITFLLFGAVAAFAKDPNIGTWKLNEAKSKMTAGMAKNTKVVYTAAGDSVKAVVEGVDAAGKATHNEWTGKYDGKDYAVTGDANTDMRSIMKVDDRHYNIAGKKGGKTVITGTIEFAADWKSRTLTIHSKDAKGKDVTSVTVYDKQ